MTLKQRRGLHSSTYTCTFFSKYLVGPLHLQVRQLADCVQYCVYGSRSIVSEDIEFSDTKADCGTSVSVYFCVWGGSWNQIPVTIQRQLYRANGKKSWQLTENRTILVLREIKRNMNNKLGTAVVYSNQSSD